MLYTYKLGSKHIAFDSDKLKIFALSELEWQISDFVGNDMPPVCPSALRYALAKYDSAATDAAYKRVYAIHSGNESGKDISFDNTSDFNPCVTQSQSLFKDVVALADAGHKYISIELEGDINTNALSLEYEKLAREMYKRIRQSKPFVLKQFLLTKDDIRDYALLSETEKKRVECALFLQL